MSDLENELNGYDDLPESENNVPTIADNTTQTANKLSTVNEPTSFSKAVDTAKLNVLDKAQKNDTKFVQKITDELKEAAVKLAEVEKSKGELEKQNVEYAKELLDTQQKLNEQKQDEDKWANKQKRREYHYDGVKPIMEFVGIKTPMNLFFLYLFTVLLFLPFLGDKLIRGTIGALIVGATDGDRPKSAKAFMWTLLAVFTAAILIVVGYLGYQWIFKGTIPLQ